MTATSNIVRRVFLKLTHRPWNREINRILCRERERGTISWEQLHVLAAKFDPTQRHEVGRG
jgi:hypothetical protein